MISIKGMVAILLGIWLYRVRKVILIMTIMFSAISENIYMNHKQYFTKTTNFICRISNGKGFVATNLNKLCTKNRGRNGN